MHGGASQPSDEEGPARGCKCKPGKLTGELSEEEVAVSLIAGTIPRASVSDRGKSARVSAA